MDITFVTSAKSDKEAMQLLSELGLPFKRKSNEVNIEKTKSKSVDDQPTDSVHIPVAEEAPESEEASLAEEAPESEEASLAEESPESEEASLVKEAPESEEAPVVEEAPNSEETEEEGKTDSENNNNKE